MRDYTNFDKYLSDIQLDTYPQPLDTGHLCWARESLNMVPDDTDTMLDVGCGEGFLKPDFEAREIVWNGITLGKVDYDRARKRGYGGIYLGDFTFTHFQDGMFDLIYSRHALEHSPFPIITLMEWHRIATKNLLLIAPAPEYWGYYGKNHYSVANEAQLWWWLRRAGWDIVERQYLKTSDKSFLEFYLPEQKDRTNVSYPGPPKVVEFRYLCRKVEPVAE